MDLTVHALESQEGTATRRFDANEPWVKAMRQQMPLKGPVTVQATVVKRYGQAGCGRLQTVFTMHEARVANGRLEDVVFSVNYNTCTDGQPPMEAVDLRSVAEHTTPTPNMTPQRSLPPIVPFDKPLAGTAGRQ